MEIKIKTEIMKSQIKESITLPLNHEILGYTFDGKLDNIVVLAEHSTYRVNEIENNTFTVDTIEDKTIALIINENVYKKTVQEYWEQKKDYCKRWGHFCGVGYYSSIEHWKVKDEDMDMFVDNEDMRKVLTADNFVDVYFSCDIIADIEHG